MVMDMSLQSARAFTMILFFLTGTATSSTRSESLALDVVHRILLALRPQLPDVPEEEEDIADASLTPSQLAIVCGIVLPRVLCQHAPL